MLSCLVLLGLTLTISCGEAQKSKEEMSSESKKTESPKKEMANDAAASQNDSADLDVLGKMRKKLEGKEYALTEEQLAQVDTLLSEVEIKMDLPKEEFKKNLKTLRERIYNEVLNDEQKKVYKEKGLKVPE